MNAPDYNSFWHRYCGVDTNSASGSWYAQKRLAMTMKLSSLFTFQQKNPASLLRLHVLTAVVSIVTIVLLSSICFYRMFSQFVIRNAEENSVRLCRMLLDQKNLNLLKYIQVQSEHPSIGQQDMEQLHKNMREFLDPFDIIKVKLYDINHRIIYSTESSIIGKTDDKNARLKNALSGNVDTKLVTKERAHDLIDEPLLDVDVVETYVPISTAINVSHMNLANEKKAGKMLGGFEIYVNVTKYRTQIRSGVIVMTTFTVVMLAVVFGVSYLIIRRGTYQLKDAQARLEMLAITDALTGIANRGYVMERGEDEFARAERNRAKGAGTSTLCCVMLDIDHFKKVNDTKGHPAGDAVLREVVNRVKKCIRPYDIIGRYGGEEFLLLLPDTIFDEGVAVAERIRNDVRREPFRIGGDEIRVSVSLGISCFEETDRNLEDLLKRADDGLYKAKHAGRDRVEWVYNTSDAVAFA